MPSEPNLDDLIIPLSQQLHEAFNRGYRAGCSDTRNRILQAASDEPGKLVVAAPVSSGTRAERAPPGTVRPLVQQILANEPGLTAAEIGRRVTNLDPRVSQTSVTNELQRNRNKFYRRTKGGRWLLISNEEGQRETAGIATNDPPPLMNGTAG